MLLFRRRITTTGALLEDGPSCRIGQTLADRGEQVEVQAMTAESTLRRASHESTGTDRVVIAGRTRSVWLWIAHTSAYSTLRPLPVRRAKFVNVGDLLLYQTWDSPESSQRFKNKCFCNEKCKPASALFSMPDHTLFRGVYETTQSRVLRSRQ